MPSWYFNDKITDAEAYAGEKITEWRRRLISIEEAVKSKNDAQAFKLI